MTKRPVTPFETEVYAAVNLIPRGRVATYRTLADHLFCRSCRAIGQALRRNPFAPAVPCHRVIASDLTPGGFRGRREGVAVVEKRKLLAAEGVLFSGGRLAEPWRVFCFEKEGAHGTEEPRSRMDLRARGDDRQVARRLRRAR